VFHGPGDIRVELRGAEGEFLDHAAAQRPGNGVRVPVARRTRLQKVRRIKRCASVGTGSCP